MEKSSSKSKSLVGFLTVVEHPQHGLFGGYLILNFAGRPIEFHCTAPVKANRAQQILYGPTLDSFLYGEQIGATLLGHAKSNPLAICTDCEPVLALGDLTDLPVAMVLSPDKMPDTGPASVPVAGQTVIPPGCCASAGSAITDVRVGAKPISARALRREARQDLTERLSGEAESLDLWEPFTRIREAIEEAQAGSPMNDSPSLPWQQPPPRSITALEFRFRAESLISDRPIINWNGASNGGRRLGVFSLDANSPRPVAIGFRSPGCDPRSQFSVSRTRGRARTRFPGLTVRPVLGHPLLSQFRLKAGTSEDPRVPRGEGDEYTPHSARPRMSIKLEDRLHLSPAAAAGVAAGRSRTGNAVPAVSLSVRRRGLSLSASRGILATKWAWARQCKRSPRSGFCSAAARCAACSWFALSRW